MFVMTVLSEGCWLQLAHCYEFSLLGLKLVAIVDCRCDPSRKAVETV
jgi:hypothetical protein